MPKGTGYGTKAEKRGTGKSKGRFIKGSATGKVATRSYPDNDRNMISTRKGGSHKMKMKQS